MEYKQVILMRQDLKLPKGKLAAQAAHAAVEATLKADDTIVSQWRHAGQKKVVLKIPDEQSIYVYAQQAKDIGISTAIITDAGRTCIAPGTVTCCAIGPDKEDVIDRITKDISLL